MLIECILRREHGVTVTLLIADGLDATYLFKGPFPDGPQVCEVADERDAGVLLAIPEAYRVYQPPPRRRRLPQPGRRRSKTSASRTRPAPSNSSMPRKPRGRRSRRSRAHRPPERAPRRYSRTRRPSRRPAPSPPAAARPGRARGAGEPAEPAHRDPAAAAAYDAQQVEALKVEAAERAKPMDIGQAKLAYHAKFGKAPHPAMKPRDDPRQARTSEAAVATQAKEVFTRVQLIPAGQDRRPVVDPGTAFVGQRWPARSCR